MAVTPPEGFVLPPPEDAQEPAQLEAVRVLQRHYQTLVDQGWQTVDPNTLVSCPSCKEVRVFVDAEEHMEVAHGA